MIFPELDCRWVARASSVSQPLESDFWFLVENGLTGVARFFSLQGFLAVDCAQQKLEQVLLQQKNDHCSSSQLREAGHWNKGRNVVGKRVHDHVALVYYLECTRPPQWDPQTFLMCLPNRLLGSFRKLDAKGLKAKCFPGCRAPSNVAKELYMEASEEILSAKIITNE